MLISSILLVVVVPLFVFTFGAGIGGTREEVIAYFSRPFPAIVTALGMVVIINHVKNEVHEAIEDYVHGTANRLAMVATSALAYTLIAMGLFALVKIAL
jgi:succinate dehydrogenase / fumarate reductase membrane anchor subunit